MKSQQILAKLIKFNTVKDQENKIIMKYLADLLKPVGFKIQMVKDKKTKNLNLLAKFNQKKPVLTFSGHTDTVPATKDWNYDPFKLTQKGNKLYGLGTSDMKGGIATFLQAVLKQDLKNLKKGLNLVFTFGEEEAIEGIQSFLKKIKLKTKYIILAEDTGLGPVVASKGAYAIKIEFEGKAAHGAEINKGVNAILIAQDFIDKLEKYFKKQKNKLNSLFEAPFATVNVAKVLGGDLINRIPSYCCLEFEYRTVNYNQGVLIYQDILAILKKMNCKFKIKLINQIEPMLIKNKKLINSMEKLTNKKVVGINGATEGTYYKKYGYDCVILGPGNGLAHQPNEYISKDQLKKAEFLYDNFIKEFCY
ncbi:MAG: M20/M25/M40 family metallo-hydrolase [Candidatus Buchananbacteria bacterium]|nr:M20/M25/M40 family metallo-hydrolase [Candidatus Buchananbacteria bacterium]